MFCAFYASYKVRMVVRAVLLDHSGHSPLTLSTSNHEYHVDIPWNSVPSRGFHGAPLVAKY
jgi:hypothetical protein